MPPRIQKVRNADDKKHEDLQQEAYHDAENKSSVDFREAGFGAFGAMKFSGLLGKALGTLYIYIYIYVDICVFPYLGL